MNTHTFVFIRYSVLSQKKGGWVIGRGVEEDTYKQALFSSQRLSMHERLFKNVTLPSLQKAIKEHSVTVFAFTSVHLPEEYKAQLYEFCNIYSWLKIVELPSDEGPVTMMDGFFRNYLQENYSDLCYATVRLDDDDAVSEAYFDKLSKYNHPKFNKMAITMPIGYRGLFEGGQYKAFSKCEQMKCAQGLAYVARYHDGKFSKPLTVFSLGHHAKVDKTVPLVVDKSIPAFLRTVHEESDVYSSGSENKFSSDKCIEPSVVSKYICINI